MKISVNENSSIQLEEVFNPIVLKTRDGEKMTIFMRDSGFEFEYQGEMYFAKEGYVEPFKRSIRGNYLVDQRHEYEYNELPAVNISDLIQLNEGI